MIFEREKAASGLFLPVKSDGDILAAGRYHFRHLREGRLIDEWDADNLVVGQGLTALLNIMLAGGAQITTWYLGLFSGNYTPVATDTAASFTSNATETTGYTAGARQAFVPATTTNQSISNAASQASFTFNATQTIYGAFLTSSGVISGTTGTLFSAAQFATSKPVANLDQLLCTYTFTAASA